MTRKELFLLEVETVLAAEIAVGASGFDQERKRLLLLLDTG